MKKQCPLPMGPEDRASNQRYVLPLQKEMVCSKVLLPCCCHISQVTMHAQQQFLQSPCHVPWEGEGERERQAPQFSPPVTRAKSLVRKF